MTPATPVSRRQSCRVKPTQELCRRAGLQCASFLRRLATVSSPRVEKRSELLGYTTAGG
jgi:hypothetical protein